MNDGSIFGFAIAFLIILFFLPGRRGSGNNPFRAFMQNRVRYQTPITRREYVMVHSILNNGYHYYGPLSERGKARFINRLVYILRSRRIVGKEGLEITPEIRIKACAALTQVTFGLEKYLLDSLHTILIYPESFFVPAIGQTLKGGTTPNGFMALSLIDLEQGFKIPNDKYNLGLHEAAHVLKLQATSDGEETDERFRYYLKEWLAIGESEYQNIRSGMPSFLRTYAGENLQEFFAVCVEHFFETPKEFRERLPDVYNHLCVLLNQNPLNTEGDYELTDDYLNAVNKDPNRKRMPRMVKRSPAQ
jgi:hypothetical protein